MIYLTFRSGERPEEAKVLAATSDPLVVMAAVRALLAQLSTPLLEGDNDEGDAPDDAPAGEKAGDAA